MSSLAWQRQNSRAKKRVGTPPVATLERRERLRRRLGLIQDMTRTERWAIAAMIVDNMEQAEQEILRWER